MAKLESDSRPIWLQKLMALPFASMPLLALRTGSVFPHHPSSTILGVAFILLFVHSAVNHNITIHIQYFCVFFTLSLNVISILLELRTVIFKSSYFLLNQEVLIPSLFNARSLFPVFFSTHNYQQNLMSSESL